jgi:hypothetical protein
MTIIDFYKKLSKILTDTREEFLSRPEGESKLSKLLEDAETHGLKVEINPDILDPVYLMRLDDENSYRSEDVDYDDFSYNPGESSY